MAASVAATARGAGLDDESVAALERVHGLAMAPRIAELDDDHHPAYLHPGRSCLILLHDVGRVDVSVLALATLHDSCDATLRSPREEVLAALGKGTLAALDALPLPGDEDLLEKLVGLGAGASLAVLAERLDHLRHLHLRSDLVDSWADTHHEVEAAWLPFAHRVHPKLATRFAHWYRVFVKRI
jgi:predicted esterase